jgi:hypothetical protein
MPLPSKKPLFMAKNLLFKLNIEVGWFSGYLLLFINIDRVNKSIFINVAID